jgi:hypothetical protein
MHDSHRSTGVTNDNQEFFDNADVALDIQKRTVTLREVHLDSHNRIAGIDEPQDERGRPVVALPDPENGYDPELAGKTPDEIVAILKVRSEMAEANASTDRLMRQYPGKSDGAPHSSSGGKSAKKPRPPFDHTKGQVREMKDVGENRPHPVAGRVSSQAFVGITRYASRDCNAGTMLDAIGKTLHAGVSWAQIDFMLGELRSNAARLETRRAG